jgi:hypothetical protein
MKPMRSLLAAAVISAAFVTPVAAWSGQPVIHLSTTQGPTGTRVTLSGHGFPASKAVVVKFHDSVEGPISIASTRSRADGSLSVTFRVPANPAGGHAIFAAYGKHQRSSTVWFTLLPRLRLTPSRIAPPDPICVQTGIQGPGRHTVRYNLDGYPANTRVLLALTPKAGGTSVPVKVARTGPRGSAWGTYSQPVVPSGNYVASTRAGATTFKPSVGVFSAWYTCYVFSGRVRPMRWRADGVGFLPGSPVSVRWGGNRHNPIFTATVRKNGSWGGKLFTTPCAPHPGTYTVTTTGTDGQGRPILVKSRNRIRTSCG